MKSSSDLDPFIEIAAWARFVLDAPGITAPAELRKHFSSALLDASPMLTARVTLAAARLGRAKSDARLMKLVAAAAQPLMNSPSHYIKLAASEALALAEPDATRRRAKLTVAKNEWSRSGRMLDALECLIASAFASEQLRDRQGAEERFRESLQISRSLGSDKHASIAQAQLQQSGLHPSLITAEQHPFFANMEATVATNFELLGGVRTFQAGQLVIDAHDESMFCLILTGSVGVVTGGDRSRICEVRGSGDTLGERHLIAGYSQQDTVARETSNIWMVRASNAQKFLQSHPDTRSFIAEAVARDDAKRTELASLSSSWTVRERLAHILLDLEMRYSHPQRDGSSVVKLGLTTIELAQLASTSRKSVSPLLGELRDAGIAVHSRKQIVFSDLDALRSWLPESESHSRRSRPAA
jgi:CRP-like cAMP-binding protein